MQLIFMQLQKQREKKQQKNKADCGSSCRPKKRHRERRGRKTRRTVWTEEDEASLRLTTEGN